jgi:hypothetical protein
LWTEMGGLAFGGVRLAARYPGGQRGCPRGARRRARRVVGCWRRFADRQGGWPLGPPASSSETCPAIVYLIAHASDAPPYSETVMRRVCSEVHNGMLHSADAIGSLLQARLVCAEDQLDLPASELATGLWGSWRRGLLTACASVSEPARRARCCPNTTRDFTGSGSRPALTDQQAGQRSRRAAGNTR